MPDATPDDTTAPVTAAKCPTPCDVECEVDCHEEHVVTWRREHVPAECPSRVAPVTAEDLRERLTDIVQRALPADYHDGDHPVDCGACTPVVNEILAALAGDPGDLPARMAEKLKNIPTGVDGLECRIPDRRHREMIAAVALSVRWEDNARTKAEVERLRAVVASLDCDQADGPECAHEAMVERLRAELDSRIAEKRLLGVQATRLRAERDALKAAVAEVRRLQEMTIAASCRVQAIDQAHDTLAALDRALAAPETTPDAPKGGED